MWLVIFYERGKCRQPSVLLVPIDNSDYTLRQPISGLVKLIKQQMTPRIPQRVNLEIHRTESFTFAYPPDLPLSMLFDSAADGIGADDDEIWLWARATNPEEDNHEDQPGCKLFPLRHYSPPEYIWGSTPPHLWNRESAFQWQEMSRYWWGVSPGLWGPPQYHPRYSRVETVGVGGEGRMLQYEIYGVEAEVNSGGHGSKQAQCEKQFQNVLDTKLLIFYEGSLSNPELGSIKLSYPQDLEDLTTFAHLLDLVRKRLDLPPPSDLELKIYDSSFSSDCISPSSRLDSVIKTSAVAFICFWIRPTVSLPQDCPADSGEQVEQGTVMNEPKAENISDTSSENMDEFSDADQKVIVEEKIKVETGSSGGGFPNVFMFKSADFVNHGLYIDGHIFHQKIQRGKSAYWKCIRCAARMAQFGQTFYRLSSDQTRLWEIHDGHLKAKLPDVFHIVDETTAALAVVSSRRKAVQREAARTMADDSESDSDESSAA